MTLTGQIAVVGIVWAPVPPPCLSGGRAGKLMAELDRQYPRVDDSTVRNLRMTIQWYVKQLDSAATQGAAVPGGGAGQKQEKGKN